MNSKIFKYVLLSFLNILLIQPVYAHIYDVNEPNGFTPLKSNYNPEIRLMTFAVIALILITLIVIIYILIKLKKTEEKMARNMMTDAETGIGNLAFFEKCFNDKISDAARDEYYIVYILIDNSYLSLYHGKPAFTAAVKYTAGVLSSSERQNEFSARINENGFGFAFQSPKSDGGIDRITEIINKLNSFLNTKNGKVRPYYHAAAYNLNCEDKNCGFILYNLRKNCYKINSPDTRLVMCDTHMMNIAVEEKQLLEAIEDGFENQAFKLYLQFIVDNKTKKIVSAEALSRLESPNGEIISPQKYIGFMEKSGIISRLDYYMFELVCKQLEKWKDTEFDSITVSCNFSRITISENDFVSKIKEIASEYNFDRDKLFIEITEDAIEKNVEIAMNNIFDAKKLGFKISLDDMGSGYTSLLNLCEYPFDVVKIDKSILLKTDKCSGRDLFIGIIALAQNLNLKVICEGVETEKQNSFVSETDCDYVQGWYYSSVLSESKAEDFARDYEEMVRKKNCEMVIK